MEQLSLTLNTSGAVAIENYNNRNYLIYDPLAQEGDWFKKYRNKVHGYTSCYVAALATEFMRDPAQTPNIIDYTRRGVYASRYLHIEGFIDPNNQSKYQLPELKFPIDKVSEHLALDSKAIKNLENMGHLHTEEFNAENPNWTIVSRLKSRNLMKLAKKLVVNGRTAIETIPIEQFGAWSSVDRDEIEKIRSLKNIIEEFDSWKKHDRPLSIAVFGAPGSGKSFAVKQLAEKVLGDRFEQHEFNLSQFRSIEDLTAAFHIVRDASLRKGFSLVFWDEFDSPINNEPLSWLKYFLVPMQDGVFHEREVKHPLGPSIFVFAGGTSHGQRFRNSL